MQKKSKFTVFTFMMLIIIALTFQPAISAYAVCPDDIFFYLKLDEPTPGAPGGTYTDFIKDNDGTGNVNPTAAVGTVDGAQEFDGLTTQINVPADNSFDWQVDESFSIEFWVKIVSGPPVGNNHVIIGRDDPGTDLHWWVGIVDGAGTVRFVLRDTAGNGVILTGTTDITADADWHHVVAVRDDSTDDNFLYVDGVQEATANHDYTAGFGSPTAALNIGHLITSFDFTGFLDEVALYDRALESVTEIPAHVTAGLAGADYCDGVAAFVPFPDDTISLWQLDEPTPGAPGGTYTDSFDGNDGTGNVNPTAAVGTVNGAQEFDGLTTQINVPADNSFDWQADESFSIEFWVKIESGIPVGNNHVIIGRDDPGTDLHWWVGIVDGAGTVRFVLRDTAGNGGILTGTTDITADADWHHVVAVRDDSTDDNFLYVDGVQEATANHDYTAGFGSPTAALNIGHLITSFDFTGFLDEVALYDRALEPVTEIPAHVTAGLAGNGVQSLRSPPVADAGDDQDVTEGAASVTLNGAASTGRNNTYAWTQTAGTNVALSDPTAESPTFTAPVINTATETLTFELIVTDEDGLPSDDSTVVTVVDSPVADAGDDQDVNEGATVTLDGSASTGRNITHAWTAPAGVTLSDPTAESPTFTAPVVDANGATLTFQLTVTDDVGATSTADTVDVNVADASGPLAANAGPDQTVTVGAAVTLDGSASTGPVASYEWTQTAGTLVMLIDADTATPSFTAPTASDITAAVLDTLTFKLEVDDGTGQESEDFVSVNVDDGIVSSGGGGGGGGGGCFINSMF